MLYLLPLAAVAIGYLISLLMRPSGSGAFQLLLSFSGAFLLSVTVFELLPEVYSSGGSKIGLFIMLGLLLQIFLEFLSKGVEHGHIHRHGETTRFPLLLLLSLSLHALLEGYPLQKDSNLLLGVVVHKVPVAAILSAFLLHSGIDKWKVLLFLGIFACMTPIGSWIQASFPVLHQYEAMISAVVIGIFLHVSTTILFESSKNHSFNISKLSVIVLGILLAYLL